MRRRITIRRASRFKGDKGWEVVGGGSMVFTRSYSLARRIAGARRRLRRKGRR
jgi:hypothetical protein